MNLMKFHLLMNLQNRKKLEILSVIIVLISIISFLGYLSKFSFYSILPYPWSLPIQINSSINLVLFCILLHFIVNKKNNLFIKYCSIVIIVNGLLNLLYIIHLNSGILNSIFANPILDGVLIARYTNGRPCVASILSFTLMGFSFLGIHSKNKIFNQIAQATLHLVTLISILTILGLSDHIPSLDQLYFFSNFSIYGAFMLMLLSIMAAAVQPNLGFAATFIGSKIGHEISRSLFPKILFSVLIVGYLKILIARSALINEASANALLQTSYILIALFIIYFTKESLNKIDDKRKEAERKIVLANNSLEKRIMERTNHLTQQNKQLEEFAYVVSHNFRAPVSNLQSLIDIYKEEKDIKIKDLLLEKFEITINNLDTTLNDLLSGISVKNDLKKKKENLLFQNCFLNVVDSLQGDIIKYGALITSDFSKVAAIEYSAIYLESIIQNLLSNALKYSSPLRTITIHFQTHIINDGVVLTVSDNGIGIDLKEHGNDIFGFNKIFHKHPDAKGVGLFLIKAQVEGMGGSISVESTVDIGTKFEIIF
ncbi:sensor histidine kinase [Flavobacterium frigoris]|uniref:histidine kinase n=1 Tax=Flavobacterium frigoris TaxID=229204 RepID=A0A1H9IIB5_FLAFI|nr:HAMP domain-containing sensor histidine kinase [Flavobacterium frigoris]SEQ74115.1 Signal transduction histidine kinase [Flavobacterium frigoris]